jgi:hypothetical protein
LNAGLNTVVSPLYYFSISDLYTSANLSGADTGTYSSQYNINSSQMGSIYLYGSLTSLSIDSASYITPVIVSGTPTINLLTISDGILANYTPLNYTPSSAPPTLSTSLQANLQGIDNVLANFNTGNKSLGTTTNDNAVAGHVGEYISNSSTGVSLSTGTAATITSINLPAGDWDVSGAIEFIPNGITTVQQYISSISKTANTLPTVLTENNIQSLIANFTTGSTNILNCGATRISIAFTTTVYLVGRSAFGVSTMTASGFIGARRVR